MKHRKGIHLIVSFQIFLFQKVQLSLSHYEQIMTAGKKQNVLCHGTFLHSAAAKRNLYTVRVTNWLTVIVPVHWEKQDTLSFHLPFTSVTLRIREPRTPFQICWHNYYDILKKEILQPDVENNFHGQLRLHSHTYQQSISVNDSNWQYTTPMWT